MISIFFILYSPVLTSSACPRHARWFSDLWTVSTHFFHIIMLWMHKLDIWTRMWDHTPPIWFHDGDFQDVWCGGDAPWFARFDWLLWVGGSRMRIHRYDSSLGMPVVLISMWKWCHQLTTCPQFISSVQYPPVNVVGPVSPQSSKNRKKLHLNARRYKVGQQIQKSFCRHTVTSLRSPSHRVVLSGVEFRGESRWPGADLWAWSRSVRCGGQDEARAQRPDHGREGETSLFLVTTQRIRLKIAG